MMQGETPDEDILGETPRRVFMFICTQLNFFKQALITENGKKKIKTQERNCLRVARVAAIHRNRCDE